VRRPAEGRKATDLLGPVRGPVRAHHNRYAGDLVATGRDPDGTAALLLDLSLLLSREQEREAGLARNDYFSLWQPEGYADLAVRTTTDDRLASHLTAARLQLAGGFCASEATHSMTERLPHRTGACDRPPASVSIVQPRLQ
jgi:hypothetical protein